jgi:dTDP-4-dehydrorhamnose 3,5-epimerase
MALHVISNPMNGVLLLKPQVFGDARGFFQESFNQDDFQKTTGLRIQFVQDNHSRSAHGVLRGLHVQVQRPQGKLVRVVSGEVLDVALDVRPESSTFGQWFSHRLSAENHLQMYIPPGFAHGFLVLSESADFLYKTTEYWHPESERSILWNDPDLKIDWPLADLKTQQPVVAAKDVQALTWRQFKQQLEPPV